VTDWTAYNRSIGRTDAIPEVDDGWRPLFGNASFRAAVRAWQHFESATPFGSLRSALRGNSLKRVTDVIAYLGERGELNDRTFTDAIEQWNAADVRSERGGRTSRR
jgi:hypothetical protein